jgi:hypothetical protein
MGRWGGHTLSLNSVTFENCTKIVQTQIFAFLPKLFRCRLSTAYTERYLVMNLSLEIKRNLMLLVVGSYSILVSEQLIINAKVEYI